MKQILLYILLLFSVAVLAQQTADSETSTENENETSGSTEQPADSQSADNQPAEESGGPDTSDKDFKPSEEISEDYPVPLPSDI